MQTLGHGVWVPFVYSASFFAYLVVLSVPLEKTPAVVKELPAVTTVLSETMTRETGADLDR